MGDPVHDRLPGLNEIQPAIAANRGYLDYGCFALDLDGRILIDPSGRDVELRRREFDLLLTLARSPGRVMSRATLLDAIAGREADVFDRTIDVYIGRLRRKIEADPRQPRLIVTVPGVGYRLAARPKPARPADPADRGSRPDESALRAGADILSAYNNAIAERDSAATSSLYAEDATMISDGELLCGRATIEQAVARVYERYTQHPSTLEHVVAIDSDKMLRAGTWSATYQGETDPVHVSGCWTTTDVLHGATWKIQTETVFTHAGSHRMPGQPASQAAPDQRRDEPEFHP